MLKLLSAIYKTRKSNSALRPHLKFYFKIHFRTDSILIIFVSIQMEKRNKCNITKFIMHILLQNTITAEHGQVCKTKNSYSST